MVPEMEQPNFIFLNTTGASSLSQSTARRMRAHITKTNFAKRRQQIRCAKLSRTEENDNLPVRKDRLELSMQSKSPTTSTSKLNITLPISTCPDPARDAGTFHKLQELVFLEGRHSPGSTSEAAWFNLIASDPALIEASMAVAVRHWSPDNSCQLKATRHSYAAVNLIKHRIMSTVTRTDGVLGAVITMAFGASLENNDLAWNIHIDGLAHIIEDRQSRTTEPPPSWLKDLVVQDSVNAIFSFPRLYHERILKVMIDYDDQRISNIKAICDSVIQVQKVIDSHHKHQFESTFVAQEIEEPLANLHYQVRALRAISDAYVQATARAIELVLYLLWPSQSGAHLTFLAGEMKESISRFPIKGCSYMNLTSFQLMIGAIAADKGSPTRSWFVNTLAREVRAMQLRGWSKPLSLLQDRYMSSVGLMGRFQALWRELYHVAAELEF